MNDNSWKNVILNHKTYIDTCAILNVESFEEFINNLSDSPCFKNKINVIPNVHQELNDFSYSSSIEMREKAIKGLYLMENSHLFAINKDYKRKIKPFADPKLLSTMIENKDNVPQLLITCDYKLAKAAREMSNFNCAGLNEIIVMEINSDGVLIVPKCISKEYKCENSQITNLDNVDVDNNFKIQNHCCNNEVKPVWKKGIFLFGCLLGYTITAWRLHLKKRF